MRRWRRPPSPPRAAALPCSPPFMPCRATAGPSPPARSCSDCWRRRWRRAAGMSIAPPSSAGESAASTSGRCCGTVRAAARPSPRHRSRSSPRPDSRSGRGRRRAGDACSPRHFRRRSFAPGIFRGSATTAIRRPPGGSAGSSSRRSPSGWTSHRILQSRCVRAPTRSTASFARSPRARFQRMRWRIRRAPKAPPRAGSRFTARVRSAPRALLLRNDLLRRGGFFAAGASSHFPSRRPSGCRRTHKSPAYGHG